MENHLKEYGTTAVPKALGVEEIAGQYAPSLLWSMAQTQASGFLREKLPASHAHPHVEFQNWH